MAKVTTAQVFLWGVCVGYISIDEARGYVSFEYDRAFIKMGVELSPIKMPLSPRVYEFPDLIRTSFNGVPGLIADSLPDRFGNAVIDQWLAKEGRIVEC